MIAIVTDSTVYLTKQEATEMDVHIVPMTYSAEGRVLHESFVDTNSSFHRVVVGYKCTTSQPSVAAFVSMFEELRRGGYQILCPVISSRLSGAYNGALLASKEVDRDNIRIVDSRAAACGLRLLIEEAVRLKKEGKTLDEVALALEQIRDNISVVFSVESMEPLRRSGRLGFIRQSIGTILNVRPIMICTDGAIVSHDFAKGKNQRLMKLVATIPQSAKQIIVQHIGCESVAQTLVSMVKEKFPDASVRTSTAGPVIAIHLGIPTIGIGWLSE